MNLYDDDNLNSNRFLSPVLVTTLVAVILFVFILIVAIVIAGSEKNTSHNKANNYDNQSVSEDSLYPDTQTLVSGSKLKPEDLDFWDKYPANKQDDSTEISDNEKASKKDSSTNEDDETGLDEENDPSKDGKHTLITNRDGEDEWVVISPYLQKNDYDYTNLVMQGNLMKYFKDSSEISYVGADISKYQDYVDFNKLKKAGIDFVMLHVGSRGYSTGQLVIDEYFLDNLKRASDAGLEIGLYFSSYAVTKEEAIEEANFVLENLNDTSITYPIVFNMEFIENDSSRIDNLKKSEKTSIAQAFLEIISQAGYKTMIYGDKEWLINEIDMSKLSSYDVWLSEQSDVPDYPYKFTMWQYTKTASIDGISGNANLDISFIDYTEK